MNYTEKKNLIKSTNAKKLKPKKIKLENNVEVYSYLKNDALFGFCVVKPFTSIRWHYEFTSLEELDKYVILTMIQDLQMQLRGLHENISNK